MVNIDLHMLISRVHLNMHEALKIGGSVDDYISMTATSLWFQYGIVLSSILWRCYICG